MCVKRNLNIDVEPVITFTFTKLDKQKWLSIMSLIRSKYHIDPRYTTLLAFKTKVTEKPNPVYKPDSLKCYRINSIISNMFNNMSLKYEI